MVVEQHTYQQPTVSGLFKQLINDMNNLLSQHIELFKYEIREDAQTAWQYVSVIIAGFLIAYTGLVFLGFFAIFALALFLPLWTASLIVTIIYFIIAGITLIVARDYLRKIRKGPATSINETRKTVEEARKWLHELR